jgi:DNA invertase Pin-like site-specific DNA recombinase
VRARSSRFDTVDEFREEGVSGGKDLSDRPGLAALLDRVGSNGVRVVIVEGADRLARDLMISEVILNQLSRIGARVLTADGADLTTAADDPTRMLRRPSRRPCTLERAMVLPWTTPPGAAISAQICRSRML